MLDAMRSNLNPRPSDRFPQIFIDFHRFSWIFIDFQAWLGWLACLAGLACLADLAGLAWLGWLGWLGQLLSKKASCSLCFYLFSTKTKNNMLLIAFLQKNTCFIDRGTPANRVELRPHERVLFHMECRTLYARRTFREKLKKWGQRHGRSH